MKRFLYLKGYYFVLASANLTSSVTVMTSYEQEIAGEFLANEIWDYLKDELQ